jgi:hypothetical protein
MGRIEGAAEQADAHAGRVRRQDNAAGGAIACAIVRSRLRRAHNRDLTIHDL